MGRLPGQHEPMTPERDRYIDLLRVVGVAIVVLGHWAVFMVFWEGDTIRGVNALSVIPALRPVTWVVQVMPLMFFVGGFSNARSLQRFRGSVRAFLSNRMVRLLWPTAVFVGVWMLLGVVQAALDLPPPDLLRRAADVAALPFWFLGIYLVAVGLAPATLRLHDLDLDPDLGRLARWKSAAAAMHEVAPRREVCFSFRLAGPTGRNASNGRQVSPAGAADSTAATSAPPRGRFESLLALLCRSNVIAHCNTQ